jgi:hypothetical protein
VRHRRGSDLARSGASASSAERDVAPEVAVQIDKHGVRTRDRVEEFGHVVVRFDLDRVRVERETQTFDDIARELSQSTDGYAAICAL